MKKTAKTDVRPGMGLKRREFLERSRYILLGASAISTLPFSLVAGDLADLHLRYLDNNSALLLARVSRLLFPHDALPDAVYLSVVRAIESDMQNDEQTRELVSNVVALFNQQAGSDWMTMSTARQIEVLESIQDSTLFRYLHNRTLESLYRDPKVWTLVGYQGSSIEHGGYLHRGFDDIDWLEDL